MNDNHEQPTSPPTQSQSESTFARMRRSTVNYFEQLGGSASRSPAQLSTDGTPPGSGTPATEDVTTKPTAFERFMNLGKVRKDWEVDFPPTHWTGNVEEHPTPTSPTERSDAQERTEPPPEPTTLAKRIQAMLAIIPPIFPHTPSETISKEPPVPPTMVSDPEMVSYLSSPTVMNASESGGRQSVWSALDRLRSVFPGQEKPPAASTSVEAEGTEAEEEVEDDESGVMVYGPLVPDDESIVELADSEIITEPQPHSGHTESTGDTKTQAGFMDKVEGMWPFGKGKGTAMEGKADTGGPSSSRVHLHGGRSKRVWVPSRDKISVQVMWWGYRIYLPPPVLDVLDNKQIEGAKRAALLTTALKWLLDRVPMSVLPPPARPAMMMFKACTPYLSYVGGFVAWSWLSVKKLDKGHGVTLTATWLLTLAVIPGSLDESDYAAATSPTADDKPAESKPDANTAVVTVQKSPST